MKKIQFSLKRYTLGCLMAFFLARLMVSAMGKTFVRMPLTNQHLLPMTTIHCMIQDSEGMMWYGTPGNGLCRDNGYQVDTLHAKNTLGDGADDILSIAECKADGNIWFSTRGGLYILTKRDFSIRLAHPSFQDKRINYVLAAQDGTMWVAQCDTLLHLSHEGKIMERYASKWNGQGRHVMNLMEDHWGRVWGLQWRGSVFVVESHQLHTLNWTDHGEEPGRIVEDAERGCFYVGTWGSGILRMTYQGGRASYQSIKERAGKSQHERQIIDLLVDRQRHMLWSVTMDGLAAYDLSTTLPSETDISSLGVRNGAILDWMHLDRSGHVWISGFSPSTFAILTPAETAMLGKKMDGDVGLRVTYQQGFLWVQTDRKGLQRFDVSTGARLPLPEPCKDPFENLTPTGIGPHNCLDSQGHLWQQDNHSVTERNLRNGAHRTLSIAAGTLPLEYAMDICAVPGGVCVVGAWGMVRLPHCEALDEAGLKPKPCVTAYSVDDEETLCAASTEKNILLKARFDRLTLRLSTFNHLHADEVQMAWRLSTEADTIWHLLAAGKNEIAIYDLPLGRHDIIVKATDDKGRWGDAVKVATAQRQPLWYEKWLFKVALVILLLAIPYFYMWLRRRHQRELKELRRQFVAQIEALQEKQQSSTSKEAVEEEMATPAISALDQEFIDKATASVKEHISDDDFSVDQFASDLCMSRMNLYRKMRTIIGISPSDFIKNQRLEYAAHLLTTTNDSIVQIADRCGFSTPSYFTKCFKEKFGITPKEERK